MKHKKQYNYNKLKGKIVEIFGNIKNFSKSVGISTTTLYKKFSNNGYFNQTQIELISNILNIKQEDIGEYFFTQKVK